jgi:hypothetical protein
VSDLRFVETDNGQTRRIAGTERPFGECGEDLLDRAKKNLSARFVVAGLTERYVESLVLMKRRLNWPSTPTARLRNVNRSRPREGAAASVSTAAMTAILERNRLDLELYTFAQRQFDETIASQGEDFQIECTRIRQLVNVKGLRTAAR